MNDFYKKMLDGYITKNTATNTNADGANFSSETWFNNGEENGDIGVGATQMDHPMAKFAHTSNAIGSTEFAVADEWCNTYELVEFTGNYETPKPKTANFNKLTADNLIELVDKLNFSNESQKHQMFASVAAITQAYASGEDLKAIGNSVYQYDDNAARDGRDNFAATQPYINMQGRDGNHIGVSFENNMSSFINTNLGEYYDTETFAAEHFGVTPDMIRPDYRAVVAVTAQRIKHGLMDQITFRKPINSSVVHHEYEIAEIFDPNKMAASKETKAGERYNLGSRYNVLELQKDPGKIDVNLKPVKVLKANDPDNKWLYADDKCLMGVDIDYARMAVDPLKARTEVFDHTDHIQDSVVLDKFAFEIGDGTATATIQIDTKGVRAAQYTDMRNTIAGDKDVRIDSILYLTANKKDADNNEIPFLSTIPKGESIELHYVMNSRINIVMPSVYGIFEVIGTEPRGVSRDVEPSDATKALAEKLKTRGLWFHPDARWAETNMRQSDIHLTSRPRSLSNTIPAGTNILADYAAKTNNFADSSHQYAQNNIAKATSIISLSKDGQNIRSWVEYVSQIENMVERDKQIHEFRKMEDQQVNNFLASPHVKAFAANLHINLRKIVASVTEQFNELSGGVRTLRSSDVMSDIRAYVDMQLMQFFSHMHTETLMLNALQTLSNNGSRAHYSVITTPLVKNMYLSARSIHDHLDNNEERADKDSGHYTRVLDDGTVLTIHCVNWDMMKDKALVIPFNQKSEFALNFATNYDRGMFTSQFTKTSNVYHNRIFINASEYPIVTCPIVVLITFSGIELVDNLIARLNDDADPDTMKS